VQMIIEFYPKVHRRNNYWTLSPNP
jgi:hypothetical protein